MISLICRKCGHSCTESAGDFLSPGNNDSLIHRKKLHKKNSFPIPVGRAQVAGQCPGARHPVPALSFRKFLCKCSDFFQTQSLLPLRPVLRSIFLFSEDSRHLPCLLFQFLFQFHVRFIHIFGAYTDDFMRYFSSFSSFSSIAQNSRTYTARHAAPGKLRDDIAPR